MSRGIPPVFEIGLSPYGVSWVLFSPAQAEKITGLSPVMQGDWRRRGILPKHEGHARFNALEIAELWLLKMLSDRGVGPQQGKHVARRGAEGVVRAALRQPKAWYRPTRSGRVPRSSMHMLFKRYFSEATTARFLVWWNDESIEWVGNLNAAFSRASVGAGAKADGPLILFDTETIGRRLVERADLPLVFNQAGRGSRD
jgi:hypothetical protein